MIRYKNLSKNSGVYAFSYSSDRISVQFKDGAIYLYTYLSAGMSNIEKMKSLAISGIGLNSFISRVVKKNYQSKYR
ncbi:MAG: hypothetical protein JNL24_12525 [Bacteroidia bacterium]|nr:hypothetical protein [Bacteroidia bacterium]